ncbi:MAG TPA: hypothetical protein PLE45_06605 [Spirochaetota bacterium]|nr:hypothetical protein [Spirochaetota bacterium]HOL56947.1 hypothetical protein [Spirochaetota bacterium]HPP04477.1 hypothetical protein [Spirochaetota bacterium]
MKNKIKIILLFIIFLILTFFSFVFYKLYKVIKEYKSKDINYKENLSYYSFSVQKSLLKKLKYRVKNFYIKYDKEKYKIIFTEDYIQNINKWKDWLKEGRRLIFFVKPIKKDKLNIKINRVKVKSKDIIFDSVNYLTINSESFFEVKRDIKILLGDKKRCYIAKEILDKGEIIYIFDKIIFSDSLIFEDDNAKFLNNLLKEYFNTTIVFDYVELNEQKKSSFFKSFNFNFFIFHLIIFIALLFISYVKRFGKPVDLDIYKNRSIDRHIEAVANFFYNTKNKIVLTKIMDQFFFYRLKKIFRCNNEDELLKIIRLKTKINNEEEKIIFEKERVFDFYEITLERERFLRKIRGKNIQ